MKVSLTTISRAMALAAAVLAAASASAFQFTANKFEVDLNGAQYFVDTFDGSTTPPNAPNYVGGSAATYATHGSFAAPSNNRLTFSSATAEVSTANPNYVVNRLKLKTNNDPTVLNKGLKPGTSFTTMGVFDLSVPANKHEGYMIELGDQESNLLGSDMVRLGVMTDDSGSVSIRFWKNNNTTAPQPTSTFISSASLDKTHQQIRLRLAKESASSNDVTAYYAYVDNGVLGSETRMSGSTPIFTVNGYTRASLLAYTPIASGTSSGTNKNLSVQANVEIGGAYVGARGNVYVAAITGSGSVFFNTGSGWVQYLGGTLPPFENSVTLKTHTITILSGMDVSSLAGTNTSIVVGYGSTDSNMLANASYATVYTVQ